MARSAVATRPRGGRRSTVAIPEWSSAIRKCALSSALFRRVQVPLALSDAREELKTCVARRAITDERIAQLRILLRTLVRFMPEETIRQQILKEVDAARRKSPSPTESISDILARSGKALTSTDIS
jgi:hypothetical protein